MEVVIACGGKGTRMKDILKDSPKILAPVPSGVFLHKVLDYWSSVNCERVHLLLGVGADQVWEAAMNWLHQSNGNLKISATIEPYPLGVIGALKFAESCLPPQFIFTYGDVYPTVDLKKLLHAVKDEHLACLSVCEKEIAKENANIMLDSNGIKIYSKNDGAMTHVDVGMMVIDKQALAVLKNDPLEFLNEDDLFKPLAALGKLGYYNHGKPSMHIGIPKAYSSFLNWSK